MLYVTLHCLSASRKWLWNHAVLACGNTVSNSALLPLSGTEEMRVVYIQIAVSPVSVLHLSLWQVFSSEYECILRCYAGLCRVIDIRRFGKTYHCHLRGSSHWYRNHWLLRMKAVLSIETPDINIPYILRNKAENMSTQHLKRGNFKSRNYLLSYPL